MYLFYLSFIFLIKNYSIFELFLLLKEVLSNFIFFVTQ